MIILDVEQGGAAWLRARAGIPTASAFSKIVTPKGKLSESSRGYLYQLCAEHLLGAPVGEDISQFMERGHELEAGAVDFYEMRREVDTERVGFLLRDDGRTGCSPDRLIGTEGGLEIKCPSPAVHVGYLLDGPDDKYRCQIQGCLWIAERAWWDFLSYHPTLPPVMVRVARDDAFITLLAAAVDEFCDRLAAAKEILATQGYLPVEAGL